MQRYCILDDIPLAIIIFNELCNIIFINHQGQNFVTKTEDCLQELIKELVRKTLNTNISSEKIIRYSNANDLSVWRIKSEIMKQSIPQVMVVIKDETKLSQLEQTILKAEQLAVAGQLAIGSLLEIRNPLTIARGFCQLIEEQSEIKQEYIEIMTKELIKIQEIVENSAAITDSSPDKKEVIYRRIRACLNSHTDAYKLIMVTDVLDDIKINIAEEHINVLMVNLIRLFEIWMKEKNQIIITIKMSEEARYINLIVQANCDIKWELDEDRNLQSMFKSSEDKNNNVVIKLTDEKTITVKLNLPIIMPLYSNDISTDDEYRQELLK